MTTPRSRDTEFTTSPEAVNEVRPSRNAKVLIQGRRHKSGIYSRMLRALGPRQADPRSDEVRLTAKTAGLAESPRPRTALELASDVLDDPGAWLRATNPQLGDRRPIDLIGTDEEFRVGDLLRAVDQGSF